MEDTDEKKMTEARRSLNTTMELLRTSMKETHLKFLKLRFRFFQHPNGAVLWERRQRIVNARRIREFNEYTRFETHSHNQWS